ncbi:hypothetical protein QN277_000198 [Acacia crassicarpa]|uniref:Uncharacterized protein n=1 Tax=Acacia crassicarpa TaxID=499986 RepID=A0AAE1N4M6_9FABA|nr:hypothetical protein QN277_000198 [Acacia crassicarpa]
MKTNVLLAFFFFSAALFAITTAEMVYDSDGDLLKNGGNYYLLPPHLGGNAIQGASIHNSDGSCSLAVVVKLSYNNGWLTNIVSPHLTLHITTDYSVWIKFAQLPLGNTCTKNPHWVVTREQGFGEPVMVGDANELPFPLSGSFFIKPYDPAQFHYKLVFCYEHGNCGHVGVKIDSHGIHRLVVTEDENVEPWALKFVKETSNEVVASDISMVV